MGDKQSTIIDKRLKNVKEMTPEKFREFVKYYVKDMPQDQKRLDLVNKMIEIAQLVNKYDYSDEEYDDAFDDDQTDPKKEERYYAGILKK